MAKARFYTPGANRPQLLANLKEPRRAADAVPGMRSIKGQLAPVIRAGLGLDGWPRTPATFRDRP